MPVRGHYCTPVYSQDVVEYRLRLPAFHRQKANQGTVDLPVPRQRGERVLPWTVRRRNDSQGRGLGRGSCH